MKLFFIIVIYWFVFISCNNHNFKKEEVVLFKSPNDTIYKSINTLVIKQSNEKPDTLLKFENDIDDPKYYVDTEKLNSPKKLDFSHFKWKKIFITQIKNGIKYKGINFAGKYCFIHWGCGSNCQLSAIVDMKSGKIYNGIEASNGFRFKKNSKIIIVNPPDLLGWYEKNPEYYETPSEYLWTGFQFKKIKEAN